MTENYLEKHCQLNGWGDYLVQSISIDQVTGNYVKKTNAKGPATFKQTYSTKLSSQLSSGLSVSIQTIAAQLGASYVKERTFTEEYTIKIPKGKTYTIYVIPEYNQYRFKLWREGLFSNTYLGEHWYREPTGLYIYWQEMQK